MFRALDDEQSACACHIHVGVPDLATALQISNHLRPWIPALIALTGNSPYWAGCDTGYASWRTTTWGRWPVAGPPPYFESTSHFEDLIAGFITTGTVMDRGACTGTSGPPTTYPRSNSALPTRPPPQVRPCSSPASSER